jgi:hypothetical protein
MSVYAGGIDPVSTNGHRQNLISNFLIVFDFNDNVYVADRSSHKIRRIASNDTVQVLTKGGHLNLNSNKFNSNSNPKIEEISNSNPIFINRHQKAEFTFSICRLCCSMDPKNNLR